MTTFRAELGEVVLVGLPDLLDETMQTETLQKATDLPQTLVGQEVPQVPVAKAADRELSRDEAPELAGHRVRVADLRDHAGGHHPVQAAKHPADLSESSALSAALPWLSSPLGGSRPQRLILAYGLLCWEPCLVPATPG